MRSLATAIWTPSGSTSKVRVTYYGKRLDSILAGSAPQSGAAQSAVAEWRNVASGQREVILGEDE